MHLNITRHTPRTKLFNYLEYKFILNIEEIFNINIRVLNKYILNFSIKGKSR